MHRRGVHMAAAAIVYLVSCCSRKPGLPSSEATAQGSGLSMGTRQKRSARGAWLCLSKIERYAWKACLDIHPPPEGKCVTASHGGNSGLPNLPERTTKDGQED